LERLYCGEGVGALDDDRRDPTGEPIEEPVPGQVAAVGPHHTVRTRREPGSGQPRPDTSLAVAGRDRLVGLTDVQDAPVAEPVETADEVCGGSYVVGADVR
jgi:hypothetical protein